MVCCGAWALARVVDLSMQIQVDPSALRQTKWHEYGVRFLLGGFITAAAGIIAKKFGPTLGGLFLAFPAIFPAGATLIEKHEVQKKEKEGLQGTDRGREAASVDAAGSAIGSVGLFAFALVVWQLARKQGAGMVLTEATIAWLATSVLLWLIRKRA
jgi:hypothetical protein